MNRYYFAYRGNEVEIQVLANTLGEARHKLFTRDHEKVMVDVERTWPEHWTLIDQEKLDADKENTKD